MDLPIEKLNLASADLAEKQREVYELDFRVNPAESIQQLVKLEFDRLCSLAESGQQVKLECATPFGVMAVYQMAAANGGMLRIVGRVGNEPTIMVLTSAQQCCFACCLVVPAHGEDKRKTVFGFAGEDQAAKANPTSTQ